MAWTLFRCSEGHEWNAVKVRVTCPYPRCAGDPKPVVGPLAPKKPARGIKDVADSRITRDNRGST